MRSLTSLLLIAATVFTSCKQAENEAVIPDSEAIENGLLKAIRVKGDSVETFNILDRMEHYKVPGISIAIVQDGKIGWAKGYGMANTQSGTEVDTTTIFQAGSISKPLAALAALKLVEDGTIALDEDVNTYLKDWKIPESKFTQNEKVTLRRLLTHTAGMTVHGFPGYQQTDTFPSVNQVLNGKGNTPEIVVDTLPGSIWRYSGGGYTVMEKVVEDVSGLPLEVYMASNILQPLGMTNSTYEQPLGTAYHSKASAAYDSEGAIIEGLWHNYPEQAAAGLWTTPRDLATYCIAIQEILKGKEDAVLSKQTVEAMLTKHKNDWGLGPSLRWEADSLMFGHGGKNAGFTNDMRAFATKGNAVIVMTNADNGGRLIGEILRAVSKHYDWGISKQRVVAIEDLSEEYLKDITGKYKLDFQVPDIGDYIVSLSIKDNRIVVDDPNNGEIDRFAALEQSKYINLETGSELTIEIENDTWTLLFNGQYRFYKME